MTKKCGILGCYHGNGKVNVNKCTTFRMPKDKERLIKCLKLTGNAELLRLEPSITSKRVGICSCHYPDIHIAGVGKNRRPKSGVLPSINISQIPLSDIQMAQFIKLMANAAVFSKDAVDKKSSKVGIMDANKERSLPEPPQYQSNGDHDYCNSNNNIGQNSTRTSMEDNSNSQSTETDLVLPAPLSNSSAPGLEEMAHGNSSAKNGVHYTPDIFIDYRLFGDFVTVKLKYLKKESALSWIHSILRSYEELILEPDISYSNEQRKY